MTPERRALEICRACTDAAAKERSSDASLVACLGCVAMAIREAFAERDEQVVVLDADEVIRLAVVERRAARMPGEIQ